MKKRIIILVAVLVLFTAIDWVVINAGWYEDWHQSLGYPIYHYVFWIIPAVIVFWLFWNSRYGFALNILRCGAWLAVFAVLEDMLYLIWFGITRGMYPYPQAAWQSAYYGWFGQLIGHEWWFGLPLGYFLALLFLIIVYSFRLINLRRGLWYGEVKSVQ